MNLATMKITAFYYLEYPDQLPEDVTFAATEMRVEVGDAGDSIHSFKATYAFQVYTFRYIEAMFIARRTPLAGSSVMIVPELSDEWMKKFLQDNIENFDDWSFNRAQSSVTPS